MMHQGVLGRNVQDEIPEMQENYQLFIRRQHEENRKAVGDERRRRAMRTPVQRWREGISGLFKRQTVPMPYEDTYQLPGRPAYGYYADSQTGQLHPRYGPVDWDQYFPQWGAIGKDYNKSFLNDQQIKYFKEKGIDFIHVLGTGGYGEVWEVKRRVKGKLFKQRMACKVMTIKKFENRFSVRDAVPKLLNDSEVMKGLNHQNVVKQTDVILLSDEITGFPYCFVFQFMELCEGSLVNLHWTIPSRKMGDRDAKNWFKDAANGLKYLHDNHISHMDIKPDNILYKLDTNQTIVYKLTDFGLSVKFDALVPNVINRAQGTRDFVAPEIVPKHRYETKPTDIYSLGLTLTVSLIDINSEPKTHLPNIRLGRPHSDQYRLDDNALEVIVNMCKDNPQDRWTIDQVLTSIWVNS